MADTLLPTQTVPATQPVDTAVSTTTAMAPVQNNGKQPIQNETLPRKTKAVPLASSKPNRPTRQDPDVVLLEALMMRLSKPAPASSLRPSETGKTESMRPDRTVERNHAVQCETRPSQHCQRPPCPAPGKSPAGCIAQGKSVQSTREKRGPWSSRLRSMVGPSASATARVVTKRRSTMAFCSRFITRLMPPKPMRLLVKFLAERSTVPWPPGTRHCKPATPERLAAEAARHNHPMKENKHYLAVFEFYGTTRARRSQLPLMNHIDEGLLILRELGSAVCAMEAFCVHPLLQDDGALANSLEPGSAFNKWAPDTLPVLLAMEYRNVANAYLSHHCQGDTDTIRLSPLKAVNEMLIADKVQNRKDFEIHHLHSHDRKEVLAQYFNNWLRALGVSELQYQRLASMLSPCGQAAAQE